MKNDLDDYLDNITESEIKRIVNMACGFTVHINNNDIKKSNDNNNTDIKSD